MCVHMHAYMYVHGCVGYVGVCVCVWGGGGGGNSKDIVIISPSFVFLLEV